MAIKAVSYELVGADGYAVPGFAGVRFSESSPDHKTWPAAVTFAAQTGVLQSAREAAAFRIHANGQDHANDYQATRTVTLGFKVGDKFYVAFDDHPDPAKNIILARAQDGYNAMAEWTLSRTDAHVRQVLARAEQDGRIVISAQSSPIKLPIAQGAHYFGNDTTVEAVLGDQASGYAAHILERGHEFGLVCMLTEELLSQIIGSDTDSVVVRTVSLSDYIIDANNLFVGHGRARGVSGAQNFSRGIQSLETRVQ